MIEMLNSDIPTRNERVSDDAVRAKTGKQWSEWFALLDQAGAEQMDHKTIVAFLREQHGIEPWWQQMVTVTYEQARGLRARHQKPDGYQISVSKTIAASAATLYRAWHDEVIRPRWLPDAAFHVRVATPDKSMRLTWNDDSWVDVTL